MTNPISGPNRPDKIEKIKEQEHAEEQHLSSLAEKMNDHLFANTLFLDNTQAGLEQDQDIFDVELLKNLGSSKVQQLQSQLEQANSSEPKKILKQLQKIDPELAKRVEVKRELHHEMTIAMIRGGRNGS